MENSTTWSFHQVFKFYLTEIIAIRRYEFNERKWTQSVQWFCGAIPSSYVQHSLENSLHLSALNIKLINTTNQNKIITFLLNKYISISLRLNWLFPEAKEKRIKHIRQFTSFRYSVFQTARSIQFDRDSL